MAKASTSNSDAAAVEPAETQGGEVAATTETQVLAPDSPANSAFARTARAARDWAPEGPNGEKNIRLGHTTEGSHDRFIYRNDYGEWYPAVPFIRWDGHTYELPTLENGEPDVELQRAGFYHASARAIVRAMPHYRLVQEKGA